MSKYMLVETISQYRMRYVIEVPVNPLDSEFPCTAVEWAEDTVTMGEMEEFSQKWLGEVITTTHEILPEHIITLCDEDNSYAKTWDREAKMKCFVTPMKD